VSEESSVQNEEPVPAVPEELEAQNEEPAAVVEASEPVAIPEELEAHDEEPIPIQPEDNAEPQPEEEVAIEPPAEVSNSKKKVLDGFVRFKLEGPKNCFFYRKNT
jgi:hypothetical protein